MPFELSSVVRLLVLLKPIEETVTDRRNQLQSVLEVLRSRKIKLGHHRCGARRITASGMGAILTC
jgi:hypothetical protein